MRRAKQLWTVVSSVSTLAWTWSLVPTAVVTSLVGWLADAWIGMPTVWLLPFLIGIGLLIFLSSITIVARRFPGVASFPLEPPEEALDRMSDEDQRRILSAWFEKHPHSNPEAERLHARLRHVEASLQEQLDLQTEKSRFHEGEAERLKVDIERLEAARHVAPTPPPPAVMDDALVSAINRFGIPAFTALMNTIDSMLQRAEHLDGLAGWAPRLYAVGWKRELDEVLQRLQKRLSDVDSPEPLESIWGEFHLYYNQILLWWTPTVAEIMGLTDQELGYLNRWLPAHDGYGDKLLDLAHGLGRDSFKQQFRGIEARRRDWLVKIIEAKPSPPTLDTSGSPS